MGIQPYLSFFIYIYETSSIRYRCTSIVYFR
nr:MAG TPA: hypothetical protein [Crassvirales sp.]DAS01513.1 MAG TPA: hypothetical protein [Caudoviricetes sp.]